VDDNTRPRKRKIVGGVLQSEYSGPDPFLQADLTGLIRIVEHDTFRFGINWELMGDKRFLGTVASANLATYSRESCCVLRSQFIVRYSLKRRLK
jgi:hypothetical protein